MSPAANNISDEGVMANGTMSTPVQTPNTQTDDTRDSTVEENANILKQDGPTLPKPIQYKVFYETQEDIVEKFEYKTSTVLVQNSEDSLVTDSRVSGPIATRRLLQPYCKGNKTPDSGEKFDKDNEDNLTPVVFDIKVVVDVYDVSEDHDGKTFKIKSIGWDEMIIRSKPLIEAIRAVVTYYPDEELENKVIEVREPYYMLLHYQRELSNYFKPQSRNPDKASAGPEGSNCGIIQGEDTQGYHDFKVLQTYLDTFWKKKIECEISRYKKIPAKATFDMLWRLFKPGSRVFKKDKFDNADDNSAGYIVRSLCRKDSEWVIKLWYLDNKGSFLDRVADEIVIHSFEGEKSITDLSVYPVDIIEGDFHIKLNPDLENRLIERGRLCWKILETVFKKRFAEIKYDGPVLDGRKEYYKGRAVVDPVEYFKDNNALRAPTYISDDDDVEFPNNSYWNDNSDGSKRRGKFASYQNIKPQNERKHELNEEHFFLFSRNLGGFLLKSRKFRMLDMNYIEEVEDRGTYKNLQIPEDRLKMIKALTEKSGGVGSKSWSADSIAGKGEGQIFLLHGPSGVGKTYTAECIADMTGRPLLSLTCADIGTDETKVEGELAKWLELAERWQAILLIDEVDVYFEKRASGQLQRNSLVSVFLRSMEYYRGILFLTTNRLGHIDDAILGRIHLIIEYEELSNPTRLKIWNQFFSKLRKEQEDCDIDPRLESYIECDEGLNALKWNGREIRNAFQTAVALAEHEARTADPPKKTVLVRQVHLEQVVKMSAAFKSYMENFKGNEAKRAYLDGSRMDEAIRLYARERKKDLKNGVELAKK